MSHGKEDRMTELKSSYEAGQKKTFTKWVNSFVKSRGAEIEDLYLGLQDGRVLTMLLEGISRETLVRAMQHRRATRARSRRPAAEAESWAVAHPQGRDVQQGPRLSQKEGGGASGLTAPHWPARCICRSSAARTLSMAKAR